LAVSDEDKELWRFMLTQDDYVVQEFGTAVIGIGALFFAYAETVSVAHIRLIGVIIALVGLAASLIVWMHIWGAIQQSKAIRDNLKINLLTRYNKIMKWRDKPLNRLFFYPTSRLMLYASTFFFLSWLSILSRLSGVPFNLIIIFDVAWAAVVVFRAGQTRYREIQNAKKLALLDP
jgi:hypothetical protein